MYARILFVDFTPLHKWMHLGGPLWEPQFLRTWDEPPKFWEVHLRSWLPRHCPEEGCTSYDSSGSLACLRSRWTPSTLPSYILVFCTSIKVWFGSPTKPDRKRLQWTIRSAERVIGAEPALHPGTVLVQRKCLGTRNSPHTNHLNSSPLVTVPKTRWHRDSFCSPRLSLEDGFLPVTEPHDNFFA